MKISSEVKIGITGLLTLLIIIWGINYLKGRNILKSNYLLIAQYHQVDGLEPSANVMLDGFKIGTVDDILFETENRLPFTVKMEIEKRYLLDKGSRAEIFSSDLLGSKAVKIIQSGNIGHHISGDTLNSSNSVDMITSLMNEITPLSGNINTVVQTLDSVGTALNTLLRDPALKRLLDDFQKVSSSLKEKLDASGDVSETLRNLKEISQTISEQNEGIRTTLMNLESISAKMNNANLDTLISELADAGKSISAITSSINEGTGTLGKLISEDTLYTNLNILISDLDSLINDVNSNPKKYVSISLIGR